MERPVRSRPPTRCQRPAQSRAVPGHRGSRQVPCLLRRSGRFAVRQQGSQRHQVLPGAARRRRRRPRHAWTASRLTWPTARRPSTTSPSSPARAATRSPHPLKPSTARPGRRRGRLVRRRRLREVHPRSAVLARRAALRPAQRSRDRALADETDSGLDWLDKMWDAEHKVLYVQVGIGTGSEEFGFLGDHDVWRLPEADDALESEPGDSSRLPQAPPGVPGSGAGREGQPQPRRPDVRSLRPGRADRLASVATGCGRALARRGGHACTRRRRPPTSASWSPPSRTPTTRRTPGWTTWSSAPPSSPSPAELLGDRARPRLDCATPQHWANAYIAGDSADTLNLYDTSALAHTDLIRLHRQRARGLSGSARRPQAPARRRGRGCDGQPVRPRGRRQPASTPPPAASASRPPPTCTGRCPATSRYDAFGTRQRNFALGANAWGDRPDDRRRAPTFPHCPQHQVANLSGSLTGDRRASSPAQSSTARTVPTTSSSSASRTARTPARGRLHRFARRHRDVALPRRRAGLAQLGAGDRLRRHQRPGLRAHCGN